MQGITLRLLNGCSLRESFGYTTLFQHLEDVGMVVGLALWTTWGWATLPFTLLSMKSHLMAAREWARGREASKQANSDSLTGLASARGLSETIRSLFQRRTRFAVLFLDMDRFKWVNDTYGHAVGDELLQRLGETLHASVRPGDLVARRGGDEFVLVLPKIDRCGAEQAAERLRSAVEAMLQTDERFRQVGLSLGIALWPGDGQTEQALLDAADAAMYTQKKERKRAA
jgi:diguanylate cyclase (GGDEF)-like protein